MNIIAIDLGSNSLTIIEYDCKEKEVIKSFLKTVRTAQDLVKTNLISKDAINRVIEALNDAKKFFNFRNKKIKAVTTEALRRAKNAKNVIDEIYKNTGIKFEIISPKKEGELTLIAVKNRLEKLGINKDFALVDIGGGSTEISFYINNKIYSKSFDLGIVTTANSCKNIEEIKSFIKYKIRDIKKFVNSFLDKDFIFTATAGTPTTIAALKVGLTYNNYDAKKINGVILNIDELDFYLNKLMNMSKSEKEIAVGVKRDDLIIAGIIIFKEIYKILNKDECIVIDDGLSVGIALQECQESL